MKLITKALETRFAQVGSQENVKDPIVIAKFFNAVGRGIWLATESNPKARIFFGYVSLYGDHNDEWGYFILNELESYKGYLAWGVPPIAITGIWIYASLAVRRIWLVVR